MYLFTYSLLQSIILLFSGKFNGKCITISKISFRIMWYAMQRGGNDNSINNFAKGKLTI